MKFFFILDYYQKQVKLMNPAVDENFEASIQNDSKKEH